MGNEISTPATAVRANASNAPKKSHENLFYNALRNSFTISLLPNKIWFEILAFVKFYEAPNIFLVSRDLLPICQEYFHSGTVGQNKVRKICNFGMQLTEGSLTIFVQRNGTWQSVPVPEVDPPKIFNTFGRIVVGDCCRIQAMQFLCKFQSLLSSENNQIIYERDFFTKNDTANVRRWFWQREKPPSSVVVEFFNWIEQKELSLQLKPDASSQNIARCLANEPLIAQFNGSLGMTFENERNLCGLEEDAKLIYGWISSAKTGRELYIHHYDAQKARELASKIALLFAQAHVDVNKTEVEKMAFAIILPKDTILPLRTQKVSNGGCDQLATLRTISFKCNDVYTSAYVFYTNPLILRDNKEEKEMCSQKEAVYFVCV